MVIDRFTPMHSTSHSALRDGTQNLHEKIGHASYFSAGGVCVVITGDRRCVTAIQKNE